MSDIDVEKLRDLLFAAGVYLNAKDGNATIDWVIWPETNMKGGPTNLEEVRVLTNKYDLKELDVKAAHSNGEHIVTMEVSLTERKAGA